MTTIIKQLQALQIHGTHVGFVEAKTTVWKVEVQIELIIVPGSIQQRQVEVALSERVHVPQSWNRAILP